MEETLKYLIAPAGMVFVWALVYAHNVSVRRRQDAQKEVQLALLNKFSSGEDLASFLTTPGGRQMVDQLSANPDAKDPKQAAIALSIGGLINAGVGVGFYILTRTDPSYFYLQIPSVACIAVGIALLAGAALSYRVAVKSDQAKKEQ